MSKSIEIEIEYTDKKGEDQVAVVTIRKIFNWVLREYDQMNMVISNVSKKMAEMNTIENQIDIVLHSMGTDEDWFKKREKLLKEKSILESSIREIAKTDFFKKRFELASGILKDNKVDNSMLYDFEFWDRQVEPNVIIDFINRAVLKDTLPDLKGNAAKKSTSLVS